MLVLSRKELERIVLSGGIIITILRIGSNKVRIGITAPESVTIDREEVAERIAEQGPVRDRFPVAVIEPEQKSEPKLVRIGD